MADKKHTRATFERNLNVFLSFVNIIKVSY